MHCDFPFEIGRDKWILDKNTREGTDFIPDIFY
jgi:hypothetical protein